MSAIEPKTSAARPTCTRFDVAIGVPTSRLIRSASWSVRAARPSAIPRSAATRSATELADQAGKASRAAATANSTSAAPPRGTLPMTSSVRLSNTWISPPVSGAIQRPPT